MKFNDRVSASGYVLLAKEPNPGGEILLAEKTIWNDGPQVEVLWAIKRDEEDMGQVLTFSTKTPKHIRRQAAIQIANQFIADNIQVGRFKAS